MRKKKNNKVITPKKKKTKKIKNTVKKQATPKIEPVNTENLNTSISSKTIYLNNKELLVEVKRSKSVGKMTDRLAQMLQLLCARYAKRGNFANYTYNDDMQAYAMLMLVRTWDSFNPRKSKNPFAFFTQCIKNSFIQYLNQEKRHRNIRDELLLEQGLSPSYSYDEDDNEHHEHINIQSPKQIEDEEDHESFEHDLNHLEKQLNEKEIDNEFSDKENTDDIFSDDYFDNQYQQDEGDEENNNEKENELT